jgi:hypothetical protein
LILAELLTISHVVPIDPVVEEEMTIGLDESAKGSAMVSMGENRCVLSSVYRVHAAGSDS